MRFFLLKKSLLLCLLFLNPFSVRIDTEKGPKAFKVKCNATRLLFLLFKTTFDVYTTYTTLTMSTRQRALSAQPKTPHTEDDEEKEEDDDTMNTNATNNWLHLIDDRKDREKIMRLQNADDPSLRAMFEAIRVTMKKKDDNMERAAMIGFERGVSFGVAEGGGGKTKTIKKKKKKENDSDEDEEFAISEEDGSSDFKEEEEDSSSDENEDENENRNKIERRSKASSSAPGTLLVSDDDDDEEDDGAEEVRRGRYKSNADGEFARIEKKSKSNEDDETALRWVVERNSWNKNEETHKSILNDLEVVDLRRKLANAEITTNNAILSKMLTAWRLACFTSRRNESVVQRMRVASEHRKMRAAFRSWMDASLEFKRRRVLVGVRDADGGDRKKKKNDEEEEEEFAPDYSEECERLQLEVKSLREMLERERTKPLSGPGAEFKEQANAFNAHLKKVVRDLEGTRSLNAQLTRRLEMKEKQVQGYRGGGNEYTDDAMKPTNRANQRTMGTQTMFETYPGSQNNNSKYPKVVSFKNEREQSFVKDSAPGNRYEHVKAENEKLRQELEKQTKVLHEKFEMQLRAAEVAERKLNDERQRRAREIELREKASNDLKREHEREMAEMIESYDALYGGRKNNSISKNNKANDSSLNKYASKPSPPKKMSSTSSVMKKRRDEIVSSLRSPRDPRVREDTYRNNEYMHQQQQQQQQQNNNSDKLSSILNPRERSSPLSPDKDDAMTFEKMASIREDYIKQPHHRTTGRPQREKTSPPPNNFAMLRPSSMNTLDSYGEEERRSKNTNADEYEDADDMFLSPTKTFSESENQSFRDASSALGTPASSSAARSTAKGYFKRGGPNGSNNTNPPPASSSSAAANSSPQSKVTPKGFTPRGEQLTLSAFNEYANAGKKQSRTMGTSMRDNEFDDIVGNDYDDKDVNIKKLSKGRDLVSSLPSRLFSASSNEMNKSASEDDEDDDREEEEGEEVEEEEEDDWGLAIPKKPHHLTTTGGKKNNAITKDELELSRSDWDDLLGKKNSHPKGDGTTAAFRGARRDLRFSESQQSAPPAKTKTMVVAELVVQGWSKNEALFALEKVGENDVNKCAEWLIRRNH